MHALQQLAGASTHTHTYTYTQHSDSLCAPFGEHRDVDKWIQCTAFRNLDAYSHDDYSHYYALKISK